MHDMWELHLNALRHIFWYIYNTIEFGLQLHHSTTFGFITYSEWGDIHQHNTLITCIVYLWQPIFFRGHEKNNLLFFSSILRGGLGIFVYKSCWLHNLLLELHSPLKKDIIYCDNVSVIYFSNNVVQTKGKNILR